MTVGLVDLLKQFRDFQAAMAFFDAGVDLACQQVQARQEAQGAMALVLAVWRRCPAPA